MNLSNIDSLGTIAANVAMKAAAEYIRANNLKVLDYEAATECLKSYCKTRLPIALQEAKEALDCGMTQVAEMTFKATMAQAGIEAAKEFAWPMDYQPA
jgi:hypothetical protein